MEICRRLAGYSYGHADIVRRAMAKKKHDVMLSERESFVKGAVANGVEEPSANAIFDEMVSFASYAFNKSHAAAYAYLSYQTAYLKYHYRGIYMAALMSSVMSSAGKLAEYINGCRAAGIEVLCPDVNRSMKGFTFTDGKMYFGLLAIKNAGVGLAEKIISERSENGSFRSLQDFCERIGGRELNKKALENMIKAGAFDGLGLNRRQMLDSFEMLLDMAGSGSRGVIEGQLDLFGSADTESMNVRIPFKPEFEVKKLLAMEKEAAGIYLSGDPLSEYGYLSDLLHVKKASAVTGGAFRDGDEVSLMCILQDKKLHVTKSGSKMCFITAADETGELEAVVFPDIFAISGSRLIDGNILYIKGRVSLKDESATVVCGSIVAEQEFAHMTGNRRLCIKTDSKSVPIGRIAEICREFAGNSQVCFYFEDVKKTVRPKEPLSIVVNERSYRALSAVIPPEKLGLIP